MTDDAPQVHICFGSVQEHLEELEVLATRPEGVEGDWWTINSHARPGDIMIFYLKSPFKVFVASGVVDGKPERHRPGSGDWYDKYTVDIKGVRMLLRHVPFSKVRERFVERWPWLKQPRGSTRVPSLIVEEFLHFLHVNMPANARFAEEGDIEGTKTEIMQTRAKRSDRLRRLALDAANGVCCVCRRNFSKVLGGRGIRVLQVHHRNQLCAYQSPAITKVSQLAVVCGNCHLLLHLDPDKALEVDELRAMLLDDETYGCE